MSSRLTSESRIYADKARDLNRQVSFIFSSARLELNSYLFKGFNSFGMTIPHVLSMVIFD